MSDEELLSALENSGDVALPYFDGLPLAARADDVEPRDALPALKAFLAKTAIDRERDARHLFAYFLNVHQAVGPDALEDMNGRPASLDTVWDYARPTDLYFDLMDQAPYVEESTVFLLLAGHVDWEPEHGLLMSWARGSVLVKVGPFDGHPTNGHAYARPEMDKYVYASPDAEFATLLEERS